MTVSEATRAQVRQDAADRCGYCRVPARFVYAPMQIDHIVPQSKGGGDDRDNLWLSCPRCNGFKHDQTYGIDPVTGRRVRLYNPRQQRWTRHFWMTLDGKIWGLTVTGRATIAALRLNYPPSVQLRHVLIQAGWRP